MNNIKRPKELVSPTAPSVDETQKETIDTGRLNFSILIGIIAAMVLLSQLTFVSNGVAQSILEIRKHASDFKHYWDDPDRHKVFLAEASKNNPEEFARLKDSAAKAATDTAATKALAGMLGSFSGAVTFSPHIAVSYEQTTANTTYAAQILTSAVSPNTSQLVNAENLFVQEAGAVAVEVGCALTAPVKGVLGQFGLGLGGGVAAKNIFKDTTNKAATTCNVFEGHLQLEWAPSGDTIWSLIGAINYTGIIDHDAFKGYFGKNQTNFGFLYASAGINIHIDKTIIGIGVNIQSADMHYLTPSSSNWETLLLKIGYKTPF